MGVELLSGTIRQLLLPGVITPQVLGVRVVVVLSVSIGASRSLVSVLVQLVVVVVLLCLRQLPLLPGAMVRVAV